MATSPLPRSKKPAEESDQRRLLGNEAKLIDSGAITRSTPKSTPKTCSMRLSVARGKTLMRSCSAAYQLATEISASAAS